MRLTISVVRYPRYLDTYRRYLCDDTSIAKVTIYRAVYRSSTKYRATAQVYREYRRVPCRSYHLATCTLQACDAEPETNSKFAEKHNYHSTTMSGWQ